MPEPPRPDPKPDHRDVEIEELRDQLMRASRRQQESVAPPSVKRPDLEGIRVQGRGWGLTVPAVVVTAATTVLVARCTAPTPTEPSKDVAVYAALRDEVIRVNDAQRKQAADLAELRSWLRGYLEATGVRVVDPPGAPPPKTVELAPAPLPSPHKLGRAPEVQVRTPLPSPRPVPEPVRLPADIRALPRPPP